MSSVNKILNVGEFLERIGRGIAGKYLGKITSFEQLEGRKASIVLKEAGIQTRDRKYILSLFHRYKHGQDIQEIPSTPKGQRGPKWRY